MYDCYYLKFMITYELLHTDGSPLMEKHELISDPSVETWREIGRQDFLHHAYLKSLSTYYSTP